MCVGVRVGEAVVVGVAGALGVGVGVGRKGNGLHASGDNKTMLIRIKKIFRISGSSSK